MGRRGVKNSRPVTFCFGFAVEARARYSLLYLIDVFDKCRAPKKARGLVQKRRREGARCGECRSNLACACAPRSPTPHTRSPPRSHSRHRTTACVLPRGPPTWVHKAAVRRSALAASFSDVASGRRFGIKGPGCCCQAGSGNTAQSPIQRFYRGWRRDPP